MWPFLLGLGGWTAFLLWGWVLIGRSLRDPVRDGGAAEKQPATETKPDDVGQRDSDEVITALLRD